MPGKQQALSRSSQAINVTCDGNLKNLYNRWGNANEFRYYCRGLPTRTIARMVRRTERTVRDWIKGHRPTPAWAVELVRLRELERHELLRQLAGK
jgi:hypothetical protein